MEVNCKISFGEMIDKMTILKIKLQKINNEQKKAHIQKEYETLDSQLAELKKENDLSGLDEFFVHLKDINETLWDIEDKIRECEAKKDFGEVFVELARSVYLTNDKRFEIKNKINEKYNSNLKEMKSYEAY